MQINSESRRIWIFNLITFGIAWLTALVIAFTGGIINSPDIAPGLRIRMSLAAVLIATVYMSSPALANIFTRIITREGWSDTWLRPHFKSGWRYWLAAWVMVPLFVLAGMIAYYLLFPSQADLSFTSIRQLRSAGIGIPNLYTVIALQVFQWIFLSVIINAPFVFGEEFGWRAYLLQKLTPQGSRRAILISGVIIGIWHCPVIAMGHNYGVNYWGFPLLGMLAMVWFSIGLSFFLSWAVLRAHSVWPAVIGHAVLNGFGGIGILFAAGEINPLFGPSPAGIIGGCAFTLFALWVLLDQRALQPRKYRI